MSWELQVGDLDNETCSDVLTMCLSIYGEYPGKKRDVHVTYNKQDKMLIHALFLST